MDCKVIYRLLLLVALFFSTQSFAVEFEGKFIQGHFIIGKTEPGSSIFVDKKKVKVSKDGYFAFGIEKDRKFDITITENNNKIVKKIKKRKYNIQKIDGLPKKKVTPPEEFYVRIKKENKSIKLIRNLNTEVNFIFQEFILPTKGIVTGFFGSQRILNGKPRRPHYGIDIAASKGTSVIAPIDSIVRMAEKDLYFTGGTIILDHGHGVTSVYSHLSLININVGDKVIKGQKIAEVGSSGRSTGPHLDWRVNWFNQRLDPALLIN